MSDNLLNVGGCLPASAVNGPGERFVIWLQGCALRCEGCWNRCFWDFAPRRLVQPETFAEEVLATPQIEGITLTGGEPMHQAEALAALLRPLREAGLSVMLFTGHRREELVWESARRVLDLTDLAVLGRYEASERDTSLVWRGSRNQRVEFLTSRYGPADLEKAVVGMEVHLGPGGETVVTGFPPDRGDGEDPASPRCDTLPAWVRRDLRSPTRSWTPTRGR